MLAHHRQIQKWIAPVSLAGYTSHDYAFDGMDLSVVAGRPYSMGGPNLSYAPFLRERFGVATPADSVALLKQQVDAAAADRLIFLGHNGPTGLSGAPDSIWGRDFGPGYGDWGDRDLKAAVAYARRQGKEVLAVVAGHMHRQTGQGQWRHWHVQQEETHYINAALVPRIFDDADGSEKRHHVGLSLTAAGITVDDHCW
jgi:uncharacterized protein (TIGR04168 family)